ncbi:MAG TPA: cytochrome c [Baekduia sp.]|nr:cytochrome c [Baekduia sp.]
MTRTNSVVIWFLSIAFVVAIVAVIVVSLIAGNGSQGSGGNLTEAQRHGRELFAENCGTCHTLSAANAVGRMGPNLDDLKPTEPLVLDAIKNGRAAGRGQMPANLVVGQDARDVASFVAAATHGS